MFFPPFKSNLKDYMFESDIHLLEMLSYVWRMPESCRTRVLNGRCSKAHAHQHNPSIRQREDYYIIVDYY